MTDSWRRTNAPAWDAMVPGIQLVAVEEHGEHLMLVTAQEAPWRLVLAIGPCAVHLLLLFKS